MTALGAVLLAAACGGGKTDAVVTRGAEYTLAPGAVIDVRANGGAITVRPSGGNQLRASAVLHNPSLLQFYVLPKTADPINEILVSALYAPGKTGDARSEITLEIPDGVVLRVNTTDGPIDAESVKVKEANLVTTNGPVTVRSSRGYFTANTTNGLLKIVDSEGGFWAQTTNAAVEFDGVINSPQSNRFKAVNGDVTARLRGSPDLRLTLRSTNGTAVAEGSTLISESDSVVSARYGAGAGALEAETTNGNIRISLAP